MSDYQPEPLPEEPAAPSPLSSPPRRSLAWLWIILGIGGCLLLIMLLSAGAGSYWYSAAKNQGAQAIATSQALSTVAAERRGTSVAAARVTATAYGHTIQTAQAQVAATSQAAAAQAAAIPITQTARVGATQTALAVEAFPPVGWQMVLDDPFDSNQNRWDMGDTTSDWGSVGQTIEGGIYQWALDASQSDGFMQWSLANVAQSLDDFYMSVEMSQGVGAPSKIAGGLLFRFLDQKNLYVFDANGSQQISIAILKDDEWQYLLDWTYTPELRRDGMNRLTMLVQGRHYKFFVNDVLVHEMEDAQLSGGGAGIVAEISNDDKAEFQFDNFRLYVP
jgi:hypothetical protein